MKKSFKFYSEEEKQILSELVNLPLGKRVQVLQNFSMEDFCKKYNRTVSSVQQYISNTRYKQGKRTSNVSNVKSDTKTITKDLSTLRRNEFVIPVTSWELNTENGQTNLVLKFK